jgi:signal transduction histidine kinase/ligand-binding sensor domain-containing protein/DNA-binding response OmpR family regulator
MRFASLGFCVLLLPVLLQADQVSDSLYFWNIRMTEGLPGSTISAIEQDSLGFIWIATNDGLCRYDGADFRTYRQEPGDSNSLSGNEINNLFIDRRGNLWVMAANGLNFFDLKQHRISRIPSGSEEGLLLDNSPTDIVETEDGKIFIASYYSGISFREGPKAPFRYLTDTSPRGTSLSSNNINTLGLLGDSLLLIGNRGDGVDLYDIPSGRIRHLSTIAGSPMASGNIYTFCPNGRKGFWMGTDHGLSYFDIEENHLTNFPYAEGERSFVLDKDILSLHLSQEGQLWIGTKKNGLVVVNQEDILQRGKEAAFTHYFPDQQPGSLSYRTVLAIFRDKDHQIWIGTDGGGVNFAETRQQRFGHLKHEPGQENSLSISKVWGMAEDHHGNIWFGTDGDGVNVWNPEEGVVERFRYEPDNPFSLSDNAVLSAFTDHTGQVWLGTYEGGLNRYDKNANRFYHYQAPAQLPVNDIRCIYEDASRRLWIGTNRGGVLQYNREEDCFDPVKGLEYYDVRAIHAFGGRLWLGTFGDGLIAYDPASQEINRFYTNDNFQPAPGIIFSICSRGDQNLWLGTGSAGLCRFNIATQSFESFSEKDGLASNKVHAILADQSGYLWLSTNRGISRFSPGEQLFYNYDWQRGLQVAEFHDGSALKASNGLFFFGGIEGVNYFNPDNLYSIAGEANIQLTKLSVLNQEIIPGEQHIIDRSIEYLPEVQLNHRHTTFSIDYQSLSYPFSWDIHYEYFLDGYDEKWNMAGSQTTATYRNVPPGTYTFRVKANHFDNQQYNDEISIPIIISPPFWKTKIAIVVFTLILLSGIYAILYYRLKQYRIKNQLLFEQKLRDEEKKLHDERLEFFTNISHELRTPLTILSVALEEMEPLRKTSPRINRSFDVALKNSNRLMELIHSLLEFRQVETGVSDLKISKLNLNNYLSEFLQGFREMARHNQINLKLSLPLDGLMLWADQDKFSMILNNLLSNAFKNTPSGGQITLSVDEDEQYILIRVLDSGVGIPKRKLRKIFTRYYRLEDKSTSTGIGLALTQSLIRLHQGDIEVESTVGKGSCFTVKFLKGNAHFADTQTLGAPEVQGTVQVVDSEAENDEITETDQQILLLIDDNTDILNLLEGKFRDSFKILKATNGEEGVELAKKYGPDLILLDVMMPGISGTEVCHYLKNEQQTSHIPIIMLTAKGTEQDEVKGLEMGADDYLAKPFKFSILNARVNTLLENRRKIMGYFSNAGTDNEPTEVSPLMQKELAFLSELEEYIVTHCLADELSVFDLARQLGYSRTSLYRKIKSLTGLSINAFVRSVRIKKSAEFIAQGMNVSEAAYSVGFNDLKHFRVCFKKQIGKNPSALKKKR